MINKKYYDDIKTFPSQIRKGFFLANKLSFDNGKKFKKVVICGMGGSSLYVEFINDLFSNKKVDNLPIIPIRGYKIPPFVDKDTFFIITSYSGNTEEVIECLNYILKKGYSLLIITSNGKLERIANKKDIVYLKIPSGIQSRLSTGYFISMVLKILNKIGYLKNKTIEKEFLSAIDKINIDINKTKKIAKKLKSYLPIIYSTEENSSLAKISKIKLNETSKIQAFYNYFPEVNHNEMVGYSNLITRPYFLILESKFAHKRNKRRIEIFSKIVRKKKIPVEIINLKGDSFLEEMLNSYILMDYISFYLAEEYNIDPDPVEMVNEFKNLL